MPIAYSRRTTLDKAQLELCTYSKDQRRQSPIANSNGTEVSEVEPFTLRYSSCPTLFGLRDSSLQDDVRHEVYNSRFHNNTAEEGGALHTRGNVDLTLTECVLTSNAALTEGGAVKALNYQTSERSFIVVHNSTVEKNRAGSNLFEDALYGTATVGGGLLLVGNGIDLEVRQSNFTNNRASHGGAIKIKAVAECNIAGKNM